MREWRRIVFGTNFTHHVTVISGPLPLVQRRADRWLKTNGFRLQDMEAPGELSCTKGSHFGLSDEATIRGLELKLVSAGAETFASVVARVGGLGPLRGHMFGDVIETEAQALLEALRAGDSALTGA